MLDVSVAAWAATLALVVGLLALDLVAARRPHEVGFREAAIWSVGYLVVALVFGLALGLLGGWPAAGQYLAGYVVERSLSLDNVFVFVVIMATFAVAPAAQSRVLTVGILLALGLRAVFIAAGAALLSAFSFLFAVFGVALLVTAVHLYRHRHEPPSIEGNPLVRLARRRLRLGAAGMALVAVAGADLVFALDSIPAIFGISQDTFIVFAANAMALLGLRPLYFLVTGLLDRLVHLSTGLALILAFIGVKLVLHYGHTLNDGIPEIGTGLSLAVIVVILAVTTVTSLITVRRREAAPA